MHRRKSYWKTRKIGTHVTCGNNNSVACIWCAKTQLKSLISSNKYAKYFNVHLPYSLRNVGSFSQKKSDLRSKLKRTPPLVKQYFRTIKKKVFFVAHSTLPITVRVFTHLIRIFVRVSTHPTRILWESQCISLEFLWKSPRISPEFC
jgi:hypothetical protein